MPHRLGDCHGQARCQVVEQPRCLQGSGGKDHGVKHLAFDLPVRILLHQALDPTAEPDRTTPLHHPPGCGLRKECAQVNPG